MIALDAVNAKDDEVAVTESVRLHGPPGTGKTTVSAARVAKLINEHGYDLADVAWATYRKSLAKDTLKRLEQWGFITEQERNNPRQGRTRMIGTFHALANRSAGTLPDAVSDWDKNEFCESIGLKYWGGNAWNDPAGKILFRTMDWLRNNCYDPSDPSQVACCPYYQDLKAKWQGGSVPDAWEQWQRYKDKFDLIDYDQMLTAALEQRTTPTRDILVVDEYHDATPLMARVAEYWMSKAEIVIVAADPAQVVNNFEGASPKFFERLGYPRVLLDTTYRVSDNHWQVASLVLDGADNHSPPPVDRVDEGGRIVEHLSPEFRRRGQWGSWDVPSPDTPSSPAHIIRSRDDERAATLHDPETTLFLARTRGQVQGITRALEQAGIIYQSQRSVEGWHDASSNGQVKTAIRDRTRLYNVLRELEGYDHHEANDVYPSDQQPLSSFERGEMEKSDIAIPSTPLATFLEYVPAKFLAQSRSDTDDICGKLRQRRPTHTADGMDNTVAAEEIEEWVEAEFWQAYNQGAASVSALNKGSLKKHHRNSLVKALQANDEKIDGEIPVSCMTIHASKGNEGDHVVLYDGITSKVREGMVESAASADNEYRTWYVALTRSSKTLHIMRDAFSWTTSFLPEEIHEKASASG